MSDNVVEFPKEEVPEVLIGPFTQYRVTVEGRIIPGLTGWKEGDTTWLCVDGRFGQPFTREGAYNAAILIAQAMAIAQGYAHLGAESKDRPFAPIGTEIGPVKP